MDSQKTTHILLTIIAVGIFFMIFIFMKERYFTSPQIQPVVWEETVPAKPWTTQTVTPTPSPITNPVTPTPTPTPNPAPVPNPTPTPAPTSGPTFNPNGYELTLMNISIGDLVNLTHTTGSSNGLLWALCEKTTNTSWLFARYNEENCDEEQQTFRLDTKKLRVLLKTNYDRQDLNQLNALYGVQTTTDGFMNGGSMEYWLTISNNNNYNSIALARVYFETGYFSSVQPIYSPVSTEN